MGNRTSGIDGVLLLSDPLVSAEDIRVVNVAQPSGERPKHEPTTYHSPRLKRTIMGGPGNRSSIIECTCGARFDGDYAYVGRDRRVIEWYALHARITGGGEAVAKILRQYDEALDVIRYPDHPRIVGKIGRDPVELLDMLRTEASG